MQGESKRRGTAANACLLVRDGAQTVSSRIDMTCTNAPESACADVKGLHLQDAGQLIAALRAHVEAAFGVLGSSNTVGVRVKSVGDWWEADPESKLFKMAERALTREWGRQPLFVREGGTMPVHPLPSSQHSIPIPLADGEAKLIEVMHCPVLQKRQCGRLVASLLILCSKRSESCLLCMGGQTFK